MSSRHNQLAGSICLLAFLFACNNRPNQTATPATNTINSNGADTTAATIAGSKGVHTHIIEISKMKFNPEEITVLPGDTVVWIDKDITNHCVTEVNKAWSSGTLTPGQCFKRLITKNTDYYCAIHMVMRGKIIVRQPK